MDEDATFEVADYDRDHFLRLSHTFIDHYMADYSGSELKVIIYILRRTVGFQKNTDHISLNQFAHGIRRVDGSVLDKGTGLGKATVVRVLDALQQRGVLSRVRTTKTSTGANGPTRYVLHWSRVVAK